MIYKLKRYSKSTIPMRKPDIKFKDNKIENTQYSTPDNNLEEQEGDYYVEDENN